MIYGIVARNQDGIIGTLDNKLPWRIPEDLKFFKEKTLGNKVVMGRKTYDSIGKPLKGRDNIVLTRQKDLHIDDVTVFNTLEECLYTRHLEDIYIIGGAETYQLFKEHIDTFYVTDVIYNVQEGVKLELKEFNCVECGEWQTSKTGIQYRFCKYCRF